MASRSSWHPFLTGGVLIALLLVVGCGSSATIQSVATSTPFSTIPPTSPTSTSTLWNVILDQVAPNCNNPAGTVWKEPGSAANTTWSCGTQGLTMSQPTSTYYAEIDLDAVNGKPYNQLAFEVGVHVAFPQPANTSTYATLLVQTPQAQGVVGGFSLAINSQGTWRLQKAITATSIPTQATGGATIAPADVALQIVVNNGQISAYIDGKIVTTQGDTLNPSPGAVGLLVECDHAVSVPVIFSQFQLSEHS